MDDFPQFMKHPANRIARGQQATPGVEGYVFDGADGSQMAFWNCRETAASAEHVHEFDEYMMVVEGCYTVIVGGERIALRAGRNISFRAAWCTAAKCWVGRGRFTRSAAIGGPAEWPVTGDRAAHYHSILFMARLAFSF